MDMHFERGDLAQPKGHALIYFRDDQAGAVLATYVVVLPIALQISKYLPPLLAAKVPELGGEPPSVVPIPPVPEAVESLACLRRLANARDDDLISAGTLSSTDLERTMRSTMEIAQRYLKLYEDYSARWPAGEEESRQDREPELDAREVIYGLMGEHDRLQELSKLTGRLRYAVDGLDSRLIADTVAEMEQLGKYLPAKYRIAQFIAAAQKPGDYGRRLAELHMERCYKLHQEDYAALRKVDGELARLEQQPD